MPCINHPGRCRAGCGLASDAGWGCCRLLARRWASRGEAAGACRALISPFLPSPLPALRRTAAQLWQPSQKAAQRSPAQPPAPRFPQKQRTNPSSAQESSLLSPRTTSRQHLPARLRGVWQPSPPLSSPGGPARGGAEAGLLLPASALSPGAPLGCRHLPRRRAARCSEPSSAPGTPPSLPPSLPASPRLKLPPCWAAGGKKAASSSSSSSSSPSGPAAGRRDDGAPRLPQPPPAAQLPPAARSPLPAAR